MLRSACSPSGTSLVVVSAATAPEISTERPSGRHSPSSRLTKTFAHAIACVPYVRRRRGYADSPPTSSSATGLKTGGPCLEPPANPHGDRRFESISLQRRVRRNLGGPAEFSRATPTMNASDFRQLGRRVGESGFGLIARFSYIAPYEDITIRAPSAWAPFESRDIRALLASTGLAGVPIFRGDRAP
jgi:hypothetical protein